jgi:hypothetical protein
MGAARDGRERHQGGEAGGRGVGHALGGGGQKRIQLEICPTKNCKMVLRKLPPQTQVFFFAGSFFNTSFFYIFVFVYCFS